MDSHNLVHGACVRNALYQGSIERLCHDRGDCAYYIYEVFALVVLCG